MANKKDIFYALITGFITGFSVWRIFKFLDITGFYGISFVWAMLVIPVLWILGVNLGYFLSRWFSFFKQFGKYVAVGFTNAAVDFGILNIFISMTEVSAGALYSVFKIISFSVAVTHSYLWNKYWVFESGESRGGSGEYAKFMSANIVSALFNVAVASSVVNFVRPFAGFDAKTWANMGAVAGAAAALLLNFMLLRKVFRK